MKRSHWQAAVLAGCVAIAGIAQKAHANLILTYNGGAGGIVVDNGAGDSDPTVGRIINTTIVAGFGISITVGTSNSPGTPAAGILQVDSLDIQNQNPFAALLSIELSDNNFFLPAGPPMILGSSVGGTFTQGAIGDNLTFQSFADPGNVQPPGAFSTAPLVFVRSTGAVSESFSGDNSTPFFHVGPYSLGNQVVVQLSAGGQMNVSGTTTAIEVVPEPAGAAILGLGVTAMLKRWRRR